MADKGWNEEMKLLSFIIPCYRSENTIEKVIYEIISTVAEKEEYDYEIIAVNDYSPDKVYEVLSKLASDNNRIKVVNFARNMGKHAAVMAGFSVANGDIVINLDDDYQCPTYNLWRLISPIEEDKCDVSTAKYQIKKEVWYKRLGSNVNLFMTDILLDKPFGIRMENFNAMKKFVCEEIIKYKHPYPYIEGLIFRVTNRVLEVPMEERDRGDDKRSGFTLKKSISLILNGFTAFSVKPLRVASICGLLFSVFGFSYGLFTIIQKILNPKVLLGYSSLMVVLLVSMGLIMMMLGLIGEYIGRVYICINAAPQYVIKNTINI